MEDVAPALLELLKKRFSEKIAVNPKIRALHKKITDGGGTYADAEEYARMIGQALAQTLGENLSSAVLPGGKMYYNIAEKVLLPMLKENHTIVADAAEIVQRSLNQRAGLGIAAQKIQVNERKIKGIINKVADAEDFDKVAWVLEEPVKNYSMGVVMDTIRANVDFQGKSGLTPVVVRRATSKCCEWCANLEGEYKYPTIKNEVYKRHERCRCTVEFDPRDGRKGRQNVHTKSWG